MSLIKHTEFKKYNNSNNNITLIPYNAENIIINNTLRISNSHDQDGKDNTLSISKNSNATIELKDRDDGYFKKIYINDNSLYLTPSTSNVDSDSIRFLSSDELQNEIETISSDTSDPLIFTNIFTSGTMHFVDNTYDESNITGFRVTNGNIEYKNNDELGWISLRSLGDNTSNLANLNDVTISNTITNNQILIYDNGEFINSNISIINDSTPTLGGNLVISENTGLLFNDNSYGLLYENNATALVLESTNSNINNQSYFILNHKNDEMPRITTGGDISNIDINIEASGDLNFNSDDFNVVCSNLYLNNIVSMQFGSGFISESIYTLNDDDLSTNNSSPTIIEPSDSVILFNLSTSNTNYYANLRPGINGQKLNIIYDHEGSNSSVTLEFSKSNGSASFIGTGAGLNNELIFNTTGQSVNLLYLGNLGSTRSRWQALSTGALVN